MFCYSFWFWYWNLELGLHLHLSFSSKICSYLINSIKFVFSFWSHIFFYNRILSMVLWICCFRYDIPRFSIYLFWWFWNFFIPLCYRWLLLMLLLLFKIRIWVRPTMTRSHSHWFKNTMLCAFGKSGEFIVSITNIRIYQMKISHELNWTNKRWMIPVFGYEIHIQKGNGNSNGVLRN